MIEEHFQGESIEWNLEVNRKEFNDFYKDGAPRDSPKAHKKMVDLV